MSEPARVMLAEDHYLIRAGLASVIAAESDLTVCGEATTGQEALALYRSLRPDVAVLAQRLPGLGGGELTRTLRRESPDAKIIILSSRAGEEEIYSALQAGAMAYVLNSAEREELLQAIRKVAAGQRHIPPDVAVRLAGRVPRSQLSVRELDVLRLLVTGKRNKEIASSLAISEGTAKIHVSSVLCKLGVSDRTEAVTAALQRGIIHLEP
jgi:two-component system, NarL family, response regulator